jgi:mRNA interferase MazF
MAVVRKHRRRRSLTVVKGARIRPARGDVWLVALDPTIGSEIQKTRPCVIVSPPEINDHLRVVLVAPLTSGSRSAPFRVATEVNGQSGLMLLEQIRAVDSDRLVKHQGHLDRLTLNAALAVLRALFSE